MKYFLLTTFVFLLYVYLGSTLTAITRMTFRFFFPFMAAWMLWMGYQAYQWEKHECT